MCNSCCTHTHTHFQSVLAIYLWLLNTTSAAATAAKFIRFDCNQKKLSSTLALISPRQMKRNEIQTVSRVSHLVNQFEIKLHQLCASAAATPSFCSFLSAEFSFVFFPILGFNYFNNVFASERFILDTHNIDSSIYLARCTSHICKANYFIWIQSQWLFLGKREKISLNNNKTCGKLYFSVEFRWSINI